jgi:p-aminobenzoyl-glutamate transporter AbgT
MAQRGGRANDGRANGGVLGWIERTGNRLPDPVFIFFYLIAALVVISVLASVAGYVRAASHAARCAAAHRS